MLCEGFSMGTDRLVHFLRGVMGGGVREGKKLGIGPLLSAPPSSKAFEACKVFISYNILLSYSPNITSHLRFHILFPTPISHPIVPPYSPKPRFPCPFSIPTLPKYEIIGTQSCIIKPSKEVHSLRITTLRLVILISISPISFFFLFWGSHVFFRLGIVFEFSDWDD